jgi:hypothetical protein
MMANRLVPRLDELIQRNQSAPIKGQGPINTRQLQVCAGRQTVLEEENPQDFAEARYIKSI